jgi:transcriptional regulator with XRE-family HTH domain
MIALTEDRDSEVEQKLKQLGAAVLRARTEKGMTVEAVARASRVSVMTVSRIEDGYGGMGAKNLLAVLHVLDLNPLEGLADSLPADELPAHSLHLDNTDVQDAIDEAARAACNRLDELFPGVPKESDGISSNFQGLLVAHLSAMLCGRQAADIGHLVHLRGLVYHDDLLGREYVLKEGADGYLVRLTDTDKVLEDGRFRRARAVNDLYSSWDSAAAAVRKYVETEGHLPGPVRITSGWHTREEDGGVRFAAPSAK